MTAVLRVMWCVPEAASAGGFGLAEPVEQAISGRIGEDDILDTTARGSPSEVGRIGVGGRVGLLRGGWNRW